MLKLVDVDDKVENGGISRQIKKLFKLGKIEKLAK